MNVAQPIWLSGCQFVRPKFKCLTYQPPLVSMINKYIVWEVYICEVWKKKMADCSKLILYSLSQTYNSLKLRKTTRQTCFHILSFFKGFLQRFLQGFTCWKGDLCEIIHSLTGPSVPGWGKGGQEWEQNILLKKLSYRLVLVGRHDKR